ncbi:uncharacterized protein LOC120216313 [Hibiscus syriacus]|uniref:uncharacterized protein LOC120216313 n=1 Tax=Hibiscus syriacus TaxID=106335 RepID=UPI0019218A16|nr:uncharacterized protein LOC120216313 [Hibiscus syriacus]
MPNTNAQKDNQRSKTSTFWTACPYCYRLFEYPRVYEGCCLRCQNCEKAFHAVDIPTLPPLVPGREAYYCCWAFFPLGFVPGSPESEGKAPTGFPNWMHPTFSEVPPHQGERNGGYEQVTPPAAVPPQPPSTTAVKVVENKSNVAVVSGGNVTNSGPRKRGRPRKIPL